MKQNILIIEDDMAMAETMADYISPLGYNICMVHDGEAGLEALERDDFVGMLLDLNLPDIHGFEILKSISPQNKSCAVVVVTGESSMAMAVEAVQLGAQDFVPKPVSKERLQLSLKNAIERMELKGIAEIYDKMSRDGFQDFIGSSPQMQVAYTTIENAAKSKASVFITGESGTGKELVARALHDLSVRKDKPFEVLNCAAIPHTLLESEIFGYVKGAFTGAVHNKMGAAMRADGGTLFLDELGEMPLDLQAKLLRFVQTGAFNSVGDSKSRQADIRFVCATHRDPKQAVKEGFLREDLYYRLNVIPIDMPPLRDRGDDIVQLAQFFLQKYAREENKRFRYLDPEVARLFKRGDWPGNVRELENTIHRIVVLGDDKDEFIKPATLNTLNYEAKAKLETADPTPACDDPTKPEDIMPLAYYEKEAILKALALCEGNITQAARRLDINPATIHRKLKKWDDRGEL